MAEPDGYKLVLLADASSRMRAVRFSRRQIILFTIVAVAFAGLLVYASSRLLAGWLTSMAMSEVLDENIELRQHLDRIGERLTEVDKQLTQLAQSDDRLRLVTDMPKIDDDVRQVGIGGVVSPEIDYGDEDEMVRKLIFDLDKIEREIRLQRSSFLEIERQLAEQADLLKHTPSIRPVEGGYVSSGFGRRTDPFNSRWVHHNGIDISVERGTPVFSTADGVVIHAKMVHGLGKLVVVDHGYGFATAYGHLAIINVYKGQSVTRGQKIGEVGNTGRSTAPHLHYEVHVDSKAVDPMDFFYDGYDIFAMTR